MQFFIAIRNARDADEEWFDDGDEDVLSFMNEIHNWLERRDAELERRTTISEDPNVILLQETFYKHILFIEMFLMGK